MKDIDLDGRTPAQLQGLLAQLVVPRPIAMISTAGPAGVNVAPFSYFMPVCGQPPTIAVTIGAVREATDAPMDTWVNLAATGEFVVNVTTTALARQIETVAREYPPDVDEFSVAGWSTRPAVVVAPPSLAESPAHLECRVLESIDRRDPRSCFPGVHIVLAEVVHIRVSDELLADAEHLDPTKLPAIGRMGFPWFVVATGDAIFEQARIPSADLLDDAGSGRSRTAPAPAPA